MYIKDLIVRAILIATGGFYLAMDFLMIFASVVYLTEISKYDTGNTTMIIAMPVAWLVVRFIILSMETAVTFKLDDTTEKAKHDS